MTGEERPDHDEQMTVQGLEYKNDHAAYSWTSYYDDQCQIYLLEKQGSGQFLRKPKGYQVAIVNSEEWYSKDEPKWFDSSSKDKSRVIIKDDTKDKTSLEQLRRLYQANILIREELLAIQ